MDLDMTNGDGQTLTTKTFNIVPSDTIYEHLYCEECYRTLDDQIDRTFSVKIGFLAEAIFNRNSQFQSINVKIY